MKYAALALVGLVLLGAAWYALNTDTLSARNATRPSGPHEEITQEQEPEGPSQGVSIGEENLVEFQCDEGKTVTAVFARNIVGLTLSDGRQMELRQYMVGNDIRFVNPDQTIEFKAVGEGGALIEGGRTTYANCAAKI